MDRDHAEQHLNSSSSHTLLPPPVFTSRDSPDLSASARYSVVDSMLLSLSALPSPRSTRPSPAITQDPFDSSQDRSAIYADPDLADLYALALPRTASLAAKYELRARPVTPPLIEDLTVPPHAMDQADPTTPTRNLNKDNSIRPRRGIPGQLASIKVVGNQESNTTIQQSQIGTIIHKQPNGLESSAIDSGNTLGLPSSKAPGQPANMSQFQTPLASPMPVMTATLMEPPQFGWEDYDAAPTPTVPAGPRRYDDPSASPWTAQPPTSPKSTMPRKNSIPPTPGKIVKKSKGDIVESQVREEAWRFVQATNSMRTVSTSSIPPVSSMESSRRPSQVTREQRPGFFRRFFGSSKTLEEDRRQPSPARERSASIDRPKTQPQNYAPQYPSHPPPPIPIDSRVTPRPTTQHASSPQEASREMGASSLKKSHSSFFRRRKKSISDSGAPPMPRLKTANREPLQPMLSTPPLSPMSNSLRQAMDSYLAENTAGPIETTCINQQRRSPTPARSKAIEIPETGLLSGSGHDATPSTYIPTGSKGMGSEVANAAGRPLDIGVTNAAKNGGIGGPLTTSSELGRLPNPDNSVTLGPNIDDSHPIEHPSTTIAGNKIPGSGNTNNALSIGSAVQPLSHAAPIARGPFPSSISSSYPVPEPQISAAVSQANRGDVPTEPADMPSRTMTTTATILAARDGPTKWTDSRSPISSSFIFESNGSAQSTVNADSLAPRTSSRHAIAKLKPSPLSALSAFGASNPAAAENVLDQDYSKATNTTSYTDAVQNPLAANSLDANPIMHQRIIDSDAEDEEEEYVRPPFILPDREEVQSRGSNRLRLEPTSSEEKLTENALRIDAEKSRHADSRGPVSLESEQDAYVTADSTPVASREKQQLSIKEFLSSAEAVQPIEIDENTITQVDRERAAGLLAGDETMVPRSEVAAWLGQNNALSARTRRAYMELFDWSGCNILAAFRELCSKVTVRAESQQLNRVIDAFTERWCVCNANHGFKDLDVVHTITYSILMLNTDLHTAENDSRMSRTQYVKNTLPTIRNIAEVATRSESTDLSRSQSRQADTFTSPASPTPYDRRMSEDRQERPSLDMKPSRGRLSVGPVIRHDSEGLFDFRSLESCNVLVRTPYQGDMKGWEVQVEIVLKEFYNSIKAQKLPLHGAGSTPMSRSVREEPSTNSLSAFAGAIRRTPSVLSKAPSENMSYKGRAADFRSMSRFGAKSRSRPRLYPSSTMDSSKTSLDDQSVFSPAASTWSKYSMGKTGASFSTDSLGQHYSRDGEYHQAIGFANALAQAVIREESGVTSVSSGEYAGGSVPLLEDETLGLYGPPWAKEGIVKHRHHIVSGDKKVKDKNWTDCFAVIEKGWLRLFSFNAQSSTKSIGRRTKSKSNASQHPPGSGGVVGGGNWMDKAEALGQFQLRQTIANALPPPGFAKNKPHVFALSLPTGAVHLFSVGTPEIAKEFVMTANYWSARLSKEPLVGGVSNIEYGWGDAIIAPFIDGSIENDNLTQADTDKKSPFHSPRPSAHSIPSYNSHGRPSIDQMTINSTTGSAMGIRSKHQLLPGDRVQMSEWTPPAQSMMASNLMEVDQLKALTDYVDSVEEELRKHNELRGIMGLAFSPRSPNAAKAMNNWEKKSAYLLHEIVKFRTYIDSLTAAQQAKAVIDAEREKDRIAKGLPIDSIAPETVVEPIETIAPLPQQATLYSSNIGLQAFDSRDREPSLTPSSIGEGRQLSSALSTVSPSEISSSGIYTNGRVSALSARSNISQPSRASPVPMGPPRLIVNGHEDEEEYDDDDSDMDEITKEAIRGSRNASRVNMRGEYLG